MDGGGSEDLDKVDCSRAGNQFLLDGGAEINKLRGERLTANVWINVYKRPGTSLNANFAVGWLVEFCVELLGQLQLLQLVTFLGGNIFIVRWRIDGVIDDCKT